MPSPWLWVLVGVVTSALIVGYLVWLVFFLTLEVPA